MSEQAVYEARPRLCNLGFLRNAYKREVGGLGYRCPAEPVADYLKKGGAVEDTVGRTCLCNNLLATAGFPQRQPNGYLEKPIVTAGDDLVNVGRLVKPGETSYSAQDVVNYLLGCLNY